VADHVDFSEMKLLNQRCEIVRIHDGGVARTGLVRVWEIVSPAIGNGSKARLGEWSELIVPIRAVAQRPVDEDNGCPLPALLIVEFHSIAECHFLERGSIVLCSRSIGSRESREHNQNYRYNPPVHSGHSYHTSGFGAAVYGPATGKARHNAANN
jgi:hypothetical protein